MMKVKPSCNYLGVRYSLFDILRFRLLKFYAACAEVT